MRNLQAFTILFTLTCFAQLWLTILGIDYSLRKNSYRNYFKLRHSKKNGKNNLRTTSLFNTGLTFFNLAFETSHYVTLRCDFVLYDV